MKSKTKIACLTLVFCLSISSAAQASITIIGGMTHQRKVSPGEMYKGSILIRNTALEPQEVKVYQTDYQFYFDSSNNYGPPGELTRSNADWISFNPRRPIISPNDVLTVNYTVKVPEDPSLLGTYWSMLMVEAIPKSSRESSVAEEGKTKIGITQIVRYGIQMVTHIADTGERKVEYLDTKLLREEERRVLQVDIENIGQRWVRPFLWAELYDEDGGYIGRFEAGRKRIYPATSVRYKVDLSEVPKGSYKALVVADAGGDYIWGANYDLKLEK